MPHEEELYRAACVLIIRPEDRFILAISRGHDTSNWGLPGGGVESGESYEQGAERELFEETGVSLVPGSKLHLIFEAKSRRAYTKVFEPQGMLVWPSKLESQPFEGYVSFVPIDTLISDKSTFRKYNIQLFQHLKIIS